MIGQKKPTTRKATIHLLIEGDTRDKNFTAYIPELRMGSVGDTVEEVIQNAKDLVRLEKDKLRHYDSRFETVEIDLDDNADAI